MVSGICTIKSGEVWEEDACARVGSGDKFSGIHILCTEALCAFEHQHAVVTRPLTTLVVIPREELLSSTNWENTGRTGTNHPTQYLKGGYSTTSMQYIKTKLQFREGL